LLALERCYREPNQEFVVTSRERFGLSAALTTPFGPDGSINLRRMAEHAQWCLTNGCASVTVFGTTGEGASIGITERKQVLNALTERGIDGGSIIFCVAASSVSEAVAQARMAGEFGCRGLLLTPPFYFKGVTDEGLFAWFSGVLESLGPGAPGVVLYNIPSVTQVALSVELVDRLKQAFVGLVAGVKDSSGDWGYTQQLLAAHGELAVLIGDERYLAEGVQRGGQGAISGLANVCPPALLPLAVHGQGDERINRLVEEVLKHPVIPAVKALVAHRTGDGAWTSVRPPLIGLPPAEAERLGKLYDSLFAT
jgi:4-hydroxy-tetrahydrodipicolinate synthase